MHYLLYFNCESPVAANIGSPKTVISVSEISNVTISRGLPSGFILSDNKKNTLNSFPLRESG